MFERIAEEKIREAIDNGAFSNLSGSGKPLRPFDDEQAGEDWMGLHILRENGFLPDWLELRKQIYYERDIVAELRDRWQAEVEHWRSPNHPVVVYAERQYRDAVKAINAKIDLHNIRCPSFHFEIARFTDPTG